MRDFHIYLDSFDLRWTYEGNVVGWPSPEECVENARRIASERYGKHIPIFILPPEERDNQASKRGLASKFVPKWVHTACFNGDALDGEMCGSSLVIIWWADEPAVNTQGVLQQVDWAENAKDFDI